jgi:hypothetical protein
MPTSPHADGQPSANRPVLAPSTVDAMTGAFLAAEAHTNQHPADSPVLFGVFDHTLTAGWHAVDLDPTLLPPRIWQMPDPHHPDRALPPGMVLATFAGYLTDPDPDLRAALAGWLSASGRRCVAFAFLAEAYTARPFLGYRHGDLNAVPAMAEAEIRVLAAVDTDRRYYQITRRLGAPTAVMSILDHPPAPVRDTMVVAALTRLVEATRGL